MNLKGAEADKDHFLAIFCEKKHNFRLKKPKLSYYVVALRQLHIYKKLAWLNNLPADEAEYVFRKCCGSAAWARMMAGSRPFRMVEPLFLGAERAWASLPQAEKAAALNGHSRPSSHDNWKTVESRLAKLLER